MKIGFDFPEGNSIDLTVTQDGRSASARVERYGQAHIARSARAGRSNVLALAIADTPQGEARARHGGGTTLNLMKHRAGQSFVAELEDGRKLMIEATPCQQKDGFGAGENFYLPVDPVTNRMRVRPGRDHLTLHLSNRAGAYTRAMIATEAGVSEATVTLAWLRAHAEYGSQAKPLQGDYGVSVIGTNRSATRYSLWLLFERGYTYGSMPSKYAVKGQSALHPLVMGAWGSGADPHLPGWNIDNPTGQHIILRDLSFDRASTVQVLTGRNIMLDGTSHRGPLSLQNIIGLTLHDMTVRDIWRDAPKTITEGKWHAFNNRTGGAYCEANRGFLIDGVGFDLCGWAEGFDPGRDATMPQPPSMFSHLLYIGANNRDVTARKSLFSRGASKGCDIRCGGYIIDSVVMDNEIALALVGGHYENSGPVGEYSLLLGSLITVAGHKRIQGGEDFVGGVGAYNWGIPEIGRDGALVGNLCVHRSDPSDLADQEKRPDAHNGYLAGNMPVSVFDDTLEYRWQTNRNLVPGVTVAQMDATTIQTFTDQARGSTGSTLTDFYAYSRTQRPADLSRSILTFFRQGFGIHQGGRTAAATATFQPDPRSEGFRWDNRLNWTTGDVPGVTHTDTVNLFGYDVKFGNHMAHVASLTFSGGALAVVSGELTVDALSDAADVTVRNCGQLFVGTVAEGAVFTADGGLLVFSGAATGHDLTVAGDQTEVLLGVNHTISAGQTLDLRSPRSFVGWDGAGAATLNMNGTLKMTVGMSIQVSAIDIRMMPGSEVFGQTSGFRGVVDWVEETAGGAGLIHLREIVGMPVAGEAWTATPVYAPKVVYKQVNANAHLPNAPAEIALTFDPNVHDHADHRWNPIVTPTGVITNIVGTAMPRIAPFVSGLYGAGNPSVAVTVALSGGLVLDLIGMKAGTVALIQAAISGTFSGVSATGLAPTLDATVTVTSGGVSLTLAAGTGQVLLITLPPAPTLPRVFVNGGQITPFSRGGVDYVEICFDRSGSFTVAETISWHRRAMGAGGGTGGRSERDAVMPGAGGAGGFAQVLNAALAAGSYGVTIGMGAPGYASGVIGQTNGGNSQLTGPGINLMLTGGGSGGSYKIGANFEIGTLTGLPGGAGGGGRATSGGGMAGGAGISGQGYQGGTGNSSAVSSGGGSGGAGGAGGNGGASPSSGGPAGAGVVLDWIATPRIVCAGERGLVAADRGASSAARDYGSGSRGAVNGAVGKGGDGFLFLVLRADQAHVVAA